MIGWRNRGSVLFRAFGRRIALGASSVLAPGLAKLWAEHLFLSPPRVPPTDKAPFLGARPRGVVHRRRFIASWSWGPPDRPAVLLVHGWGETAAHMRSLVHPLLAEGFRV